MGKKKPEPTNIPSDAFNAERTDNWNKKMGRTWYLIAMCPPGDPEQFK